MKKSIVVRLRESLRNCVIKARHFVLTKVYHMDIDASAKLSFGTILDKTNPRGVHIGPRVISASGACILSHDFSRHLHTDTFIHDSAFIGYNAIILPGITVGRGAVIGSGAVVRKNVPPYATVIGNPARVIGFVMTPEQIVAHEESHYSEADRIPIETLTKNYNRYFFNRREEIASFVK